MKLKDKIISKLNYVSIICVLVLINSTITYAQTEATQAELSFPQRLIAMLPMVAIIFGIFYFLVILPQRKQEIEFTKLVDNLKKGDSVVTKSGIIGKVSNITKEIVTLEVSKDTKVKFKKDSIQSFFQD